MLWTSWDHSITSREAAINLSKGITSTFKVRFSYYVVSQKHNVIEKMSGEELYFPIPLFATLRGTYDPMALYNKSKGEKKSLLNCSLSLMVNLKASPPTVDQL